MQFNELLEYILNDDTVEKSKAQKKRNTKNKKKARKNKEKNENIENVGLEENEVYEFRNKLRDNSVNANLVLNIIIKTLKVIPKFSKNFMKNLENLNDGK